MSTKLIFHISVFAGYLYTLRYDIYNIGDEYDNKFGYLLTYKGYAGKFKYMTFINFLLQTIFFASAIICDVWDGSAKRSDSPKKHGREPRQRVQSILDTLFTCVCYPLGMFVVITFWSIYAVDRELIFPKRLDGVIPAWMNHTMHTVVLPVLLMEKYLVYHPYPSRRKGFFILLSISLGYLLWIMWVAYVSDYWVYPVLAVLEAHQKVIFITVLLAFSISIYLLGESINNFLWKKRPSVEKKKTR